MSLYWKRNDHLDIRGNKKTIPTNISRERLDNSKGYTAKNIVFVTFAFNDRNMFYYDFRLC
jgi:hypothetical protein